MVLVTSDMEKALISLMESKQLDVKTRKKYLEFYYKYANIYKELNVKNVDNFLKQNRSSPPRSMIKNLLTAIQRWDFSQEDKDFISKIDIPKVTGKQVKKKPRFITRDEVKILVRGIPTNNELVDGRTRIMILVQFWGGLRLEELLGITLEDLQIDKYNPVDKFKIIRIRSETAKFKKERQAYIPKDVYLVLIEWLKLYIKHESNYQRDFSETESIWGIKSNRYKALLYKWSYEILGKKYNTHSLRHGRGTDLRKVEGWGIEEIKEYMGHSDISSTQVYVHLSNEDIKNKLES